jgi:protein SCO1
MAVLLGLVATPLAGCGAGGQRAEAPAIGGPFNLVDQDGRPTTDQALKGRWTAVYFGYTSCPDACPATLNALALAQEKLAAKGRALSVLFITVDPDRDTPEKLKAYLASPSFPKNLTGLTGAPTAIAAAARSYKVYFSRAGSGPEYSVDHTSVVYVMGPDGRFRAPLNFGLSPDQMADQIEAAIRAG